jgi:anion-transporting  ArsA/GET3 family ATPase
VSIGPLLESRRVVLCVGSGGVGKTTTAAALGLAAASRGMRALCLTIDPARRLAQSLGLERFTDDAQQVGPALFEQAGLRVSGTLTVMMLDTKRTFDQIVHRYAPSDEARERILANRLYRHVSSALAGTQEYMAMEKLHEVKADPRFDIIFLDTPPTPNALDFLDAPAKLIDALDSSAMRWFVQAFQSTGRLSLGLLARSAAMALRGVGRLTGGGFLEQVAEFVTQLNGLFGGFKDRAREVQAALRAADVAYVVVTSPSPMAIREALFFSERLEQLSMSSDAFVVNRVHTPPAAIPALGPIAAAVERAGLRLDDDAPERLRKAVDEEARLAQVDARHLRVLDDALGSMSRQPMRAQVPALPYDVHDLPSLAEVAAAIVGRAIPRVSVCPERS